MTVLLCIPNDNAIIHFSPYLHKNLSAFWIVSILTGGGMNSYYNLTCICLIIDDSEHLFIDLFPICMSSLEN